LLGFARAICSKAEVSLTVAIETNGLGFQGFIVELPGAYVRGVTEEEALSKTHQEAGCYTEWIGGELKVLPEIRIVQTHQSALSVEDADGEILLDADRERMELGEFRQMTELVKFSCLSFEKLCDSAQLEDWVDKTRVGRTFYGEKPKTIREIFDHVNRTQYYYLSRLGIRIRDKEGLGLMESREPIIDHLEDLFKQEGNSKVHHIQEEAWTVKKVFRRFAWHDRIHGKAITRILKKQLALGLIDQYEDPFLFREYIRQRS
jgi:hypothetical protein